MYTLPHMVRLPLTAEDMPRHVTGEYFPKVNLSKTGRVHASRRVVHEDGETLVQLSILVADGEIS